MCRRSRRARRCTDSSLHAGSLLFTGEKKQRSSFIGCSLSPDLGTTVHSQGSESTPMRIIFTSCFHLGSTVRRCGRGPEFQVSRLSLFCQVIQNTTKIKNYTTYLTFLSLWKSSDRKRHDITPGSEGLMGFRLEADGRAAIKYQVLPDGSSLIHHSGDKEAFTRLPVCHFTHNHCQSSEEGGGFMTNVKNFSRFSTDSPKPLDTPEGPTLRQFRSPERRHLCVPTASG